MKLPIPDPSEQGIKTERGSHNIRGLSSVLQSTERAISQPEGEAAAKAARKGGTYELKAWLSAGWSMEGAA